jgi:polyisoprenoid-binding protein YceI
LFLFVWISTTISAQNWKPVTASVSFKIKQFGITVKGTFKGFVGTLKFDPDDFVNASLTASVDAKYIEYR